MASDQYISVRETSQLLGVSEKTVMDMIEKKELHAYRIANQFLRLKRSEVMGLHRSGAVEVETVSYPYTRAQRIRDFLYFNNFYIVTSIIIGILILVILRT